MRYLTTGACVWTLVTMVAAAEEPQPWNLVGRVEIEHRADHFKAKVYLRNPTDKDISFVCGRGGVSKTLVPSFSCRSMSVSPAKFRHPPRRAMRPVTFMVPAGKEVLYDDYIIAYPEVRSGTHKLGLRFAFGTRNHQMLDTQGELTVPKRPNEPATPADGEDAAAE